MKSKTNGFATKEDLNKLGLKMDKRFEDVNQKVALIRVLVQEDLKWFKHDLLQEFRHEWNIRIDPILADIENHREQEILWAEQDHRRDEKIDRIEKLLYNVAKKVGARADDIS